MFDQVRDTPRHVFRKVTVLKKSTKFLRKTSVGEYSVSHFYVERNYVTGVSVQVFWNSALWNSNEEELLHNVDIAILLSAPNMVSLTQSK